MAKSNIRVTVTGVGSKFPSRAKGTRAGIQVNSFGLEALQGITGADMEPILLRAMEPALEQATEEWPVVTGASRDTLELVVTEVGNKSARVALTGGGQKLVEDPRNKSKKDYVPFIEADRGILLSSIILNQPQIGQTLRAGIRSLIESRLKR